MWCSGITPAQHAGGPELKPQHVHLCSDAREQRRVAGDVPGAGARAWLQTSKSHTETGHVHWSQHSETGQARWAIHTPRQDRVADLQRVRLTS